MRRPTSQAGSVRFAGAVGGRLQSFWREDMRFGVKAAAAIAKRTELQPELFGQAIDVMSDVQLSLWKTAERLVGPIDMVNAGCRRHGHVEFIESQGRVRLQTIAMRGRRVCWG